MAIGVRIGGGAGALGDALAPADLCLWKRAGGGVTRAGRERGACESHRGGHSRGSNFFCWMRVSLRRRTPSRMKCLCYAGGRRGRRGSECRRHQSRKARKLGGALNGSFMPQGDSQPQSTIRSYALRDSMRRFAHLAVIDPRAGRVSSRSVRRRNLNASQSSALTQPFAGECANFASTNFAKFCAPGSTR